MSGARIALLCFLQCALPALLFAQAMPAVGSPAPEFTLPSQLGNPVSLKDYRGKWVVLYFYPFPGRCPLEVDGFRRDKAEYQKMGTVVFGISVDSVGWQKNCARENANFELLADTDGVVSRAYGTLTDLILLKFESRDTFIIDPEGKVARVFTKVADPAQHSREVLAALRELQHASSTPKTSH
ncbi:MAG TPA: peroxiredoxin [Terriglobales bacterium]|nr:peroxiredoxin [Terriglobales bacterium]